VDVEYNIKVDLQEIRIRVARDIPLWRDLWNTVMNLRVLYNAGNFLNWGSVSFTRRNVRHES